MENNHKFSVIIAAYQEESGINNVLTELINLRKENSFIDEIIVVDDDSNDITVEIVRSYPEFKLIQYSHTRGYGASLKTGIANAKTDADCTYPVSSLLIPNKIFMALENI